MYLVNFNSLKKASLLLFVLFVSTITFAQTSFKVVCDKTDNTVKIVESTNHSPNYVPIKSGFPFRQIAQKWIDDNYSTTVCNPGEIVKQIQAEAEKSAPPQVTNNNNETTQQAAANTPLQPRPSSATQSPPYKNSSFVINAKFSDLGRAFSLDKSFAPGFGVGFEQLFGKKYYLGIGVNMDFYFTDFASVGDYEKMSFYFGKIPLFLGYRMYQKNMFIMYEAGVEINTEMRSTDDDFDFLGKSLTSNSFDITARVKVGTGRFMLIMGSEFWVSEIFENDDYRMIAVYLGLKLSF